MRCLNCRVKNANRPRGLCWRCYYTLGLREDFAPVNKFGRRAEVGLTQKVKTPTPTDAMPGTEEKVAVLVSRAANGEALWHPDDAKHFVEPEPEPIELRPLRNLAPKAKRL